MIKKLFDPSSKFMKSIKYYMSSTSQIWLAPKNVNVDDIDLFKFCVDGKMWVGLLNQFADKDLITYGHNSQKYANMMAE